jgi:hypothetical protein
MTLLLSIKVRMYHLSEYNMLPGTIVLVNMTYKFQYNS